MKPVKYLIANSSQHYTTICTFPTPGHMQVKKKKSLPETRDPSGRLRFRKYSSHYARITCVALYRASGMLKNRSTERKTLMLNPHRACRDLSWEEKANPASPDSSNKSRFFYQETARGDEGRVWRPSEESLVKAKEFSEQEEAGRGDRKEAFPHV